MRPFPLAGQMPFRLALLVSAVLLGSVCVHAWTILSAPGQPVASAPARAPLAAPSIDPASLHVFGVAAAPVTTEMEGPPANLSLTGVISARQGRPAAALITVDGKPQAFLVGDVVTGAWTLAEIRSDRVVLEQSGARSELPLNEGHGGSPVRAMPPPQAPTAGSIMPTPGRLGGPGQEKFKLDVQSLGPNHLSFSKLDLNRGLQDPRQGNAMGRASPAAGGGLTLDEVPAGSLADRLGLRSGDVLRQANGQTLNALTDLPRLYQEFGTTPEVRLEVTRDGQQTVLQYTVRP